MTYFYPGNKVLSENNNSQLSNKKMRMNSCFQKHTAKISRKFILLFLFSTTFHLGSNAQTELITIDNGGETPNTSSAVPIKMDSDDSKKEKGGSKKATDASLKGKQASPKATDVLTKEKEASQFELKEKSSKDKSMTLDTKSVLPFYLPFPVLCTDAFNAEFSKFNENSFATALTKCSGLVALNYDDIKNNENQPKNKSQANQNLFISKQAKALIDLERRESIESLYQLQLFIQNKVELDSKTYFPIPIPNKELVEKENSGSYSDACTLYVRTLLTIIEFYPFIKDKYNQLGVEIPTSKSDIDPVELVSQLNSKIQINTKQ